MIRVDGHQNLYREESGAIVNTDANAYNQYIKMRNERKKKGEEIEEIKKDIDEIKLLLQELINGSKSNSTWFNW